MAPSITERRNNETKNSDSAASDVAGIHQRVHPKLANMMDLCAAIKAGVGSLDFPGLPGLRVERRIYGAIIDALIEQRDPNNGPLLEVAQSFNAGVCRAVDEVLDPLRQPDILEQPSQSVELREMAEARDTPPASSGAGGNSACDDKVLKAEILQIAGDGVIEASLLFERVLDTAKEGGADPRCLAVARIKVQEAELWADRAVLLGLQEQKAGDL